MDEGGEVEEQGGDEGEDEEGEDFEFEDEDWNPLLDDPTMCKIRVLRPESPRNYCFSSCLFQIDL